MRKLFFLLMINFLTITFFTSLSFADNCSKCHKKETTQFKQSVHASEIGCTDCHSNADTKHGKGFKSAVNCIDCHDKMEGVKKTVHAKALFNKKQDVFMCYKCHGKHLILPKNNPDSKVNLCNLKDTCTSCHTDIKKTWGKFRISAHEKFFTGDKYNDSNCLNCHHGAVAHGEKNLNPSYCNKCHNIESSKFHTQTISSIRWWDLLAFLFFIAVILCITSRFYKLINKKNQ
jgi:uncharacterized protein YlaI